MRKTFIDGTSFEDIHKEADNELAIKGLTKVLEKSLLVAAPIAIAIGIGSHYLENAWIPTEYLSKVPTLARIATDVVISCLSLRGVIKIISPLFIDSTIRKQFEQDYSKGDLFGETYTRKLKEKIKEVGREGLPQEMNCYSRHGE